MSIPLPFRKRNQRSARDQARQAWIDERRREARIVVADVVHHSDHLLRMACKVLVQHGETPEECEEDRKSTRLNSSHLRSSRMPSSA